MSTYDKYRAGEYTNAAPYPTKPVEPAVMRKRARDLTQDELASLGEISLAYQGMMAAYRAETAAHRTESGRLDSLLQADLEAEYGVTGHPKAALLWEKAYDRGHSAGMGEVMNVWIDLVDLIV